MATRGFVTIATGSEKYYKLAAQLLKSYKKRSVQDTPFAIICDRENEYTQGFDQVICMEEPNKSYMDKLLLYRYSPYEETIFIDADSLILADPAGLWDDYADADDVSCCGAIYPLDSDRGWFTYEGSGKYKEQLKYVIDLHGGIYYFRRTERCRAIFEKAIELAGEYSLYAFKNFSKPADEPVMALAMAIFDCQPCTKPARILFVPSYRGKLRVNIRGELLVSGKKSGVEILHFATPNTELFLYQYLSRCLEQTEVPPLGHIGGYFVVALRTFPKECKIAIRHAGGWVLRKFLPAEVVQRLKERNKLRG